MADPKIGYVHIHDGKKFYISERNGARFFQEIVRADGTLSYVSVDGTPEYLGAKIFDRQNGRQIPEVIECNADEGWVICADGEPHVCDSSPPCYAPSCWGNRSDHVRLKRLDGEFEIVMDDDYDSFRTAIMAAIRAFR